MGNEIKNVEKGRKKETPGVSFFRVHSAEKSAQASDFSRSILPPTVSSRGSPFTAAENNVAETFVWQLARRRRRRYVFRIRKPVSLLEEQRRIRSRLTKFRRTIPGRNVGHAEACPSTTRTNLSRRRVPSGIFLTFPPFHFFPRRFSSNRII